MAERTAPYPERQWQVDILVADGFVLTELAGVADVLRIANPSCQQQNG